MWLNEVQNDDWGFPFYAGGDSDANSTGLSGVAIQTVQPQDRSGRVPNAQAWIGSLKLKCSSGGGLAYQKGGPANGLASSQAYMGLSGALPVDPVDTLSPNPDCKKRNAVFNVGGFLASAIAQDGAVQSDFGSGADYSSTGWAVLGLVANGVGKGAVKSGVSTLTKDAKSYTYSGGDLVPAAAGLLLMVAAATDEDPRSFGGINLKRALIGSMQ